jgi:hypothetical protein
MIKEFCFGGIIWIVSKPSCVSIGSWFSKGLHIASGAASSFASKK